MAGWRIPDRAGAGGRGTRQLQSSNGTSTGQKAIAASNATFGVTGAAPPDNRDLAYAGYIMLAAVLLMVTLCLVYREYSFVKQEVVMRRWRIPFAFYARKGTSSHAAAGEVCTFCMSEFRCYSRIAVLPPCGHIYHRGCLRKELAKEAPRCPLCRAAL